MKAATFRKVDPAYEDAANAYYASLPWSYSQEQKVGRDQYFTIEDVSGRNLTTIRGKEFARVMAASPHLLDFVYAAVGALRNYPDAHPLVEWGNRVLEQATGKSLA